MNTNKYSRHSRTGSGHRLIAIFLVLAMATAACAGDDGSSAADATDMLSVDPAVDDTQQDQLTLGMVSAFTGALGVYGTEQEKVAQIALDDVNEGGGVFGQDVKLVFADSASESAQGVAEAQRLLNVEAVDVFVDGGISSGVNLAVKESVTGPAGVVHLCPSCVAGSLTAGQEDQQGLFFRVRADLQALTDVLADLIAQQDVNDVCLIYVDNATGQGSVEPFEERFLETNPDGDVVSVATPDAAVSSRLSELTDCTSDGHRQVATVVHGIGQIDQLIKEGLENSLVDRFWLTEDAELPDMFEEFGWDTLDGTVGISGGTAPGEALEYLTATFEEEHGENMQLMLNALYYDPVILAALAAQEAGSTDGEDVRDAMFRVANGPGEKIGTGPEEYQRAIELLKAGEDIDYNGVGNIEFTDGGEQTAGVVRVWAVDGATESLLDLGNAWVDRSTGEFTFQPNDDCGRCQELLSLG